MKPDLTVVIHGGKGKGESAFIGEMAELVLACGGTVEVVAGPAGAEKYPVRVPDPDQFNKPLRVRFVETVANVQPRARRTRA